MRTGGIAAAHDPIELGALDRPVKRSATLPGDPIENLYRIVANAGASLDGWVDGGMMATYAAAPRLHDEADLRVWALRQSLEVAGDLWKAQRSAQDQLATALVVPWTSAARPTTSRFPAHPPHQPRRR
jgi:hypothetical protein